MGRPCATDARVSPASLAVQLLNGLASASSLFLISAGLTLIFGVTRIVNFAHGSFFMLGAYVAYSAATALGAAAVGEAEISMGGEDFAFYAEKVPGAMFRLGVGRPGDVEAVDIHRPNFDVDERAIAVGVRVFVHTVLTALAATTL